MSTKVADSFVSEQTAHYLLRDGWQDWTPVITQSVNVTFTLNYARYVVIADTVHMVVNLSCTSAGTAGSTIIISGIPAAIAPVNFDATGINVVGTGLVENGATRYVGAVIAVSANDFRIIVSGNAAAVGNTPNFGLANGDVISLQVTYER